MSELSPVPASWRRGTLLRGVGSFYTVLGQDGLTYTLRCKKKFRHQRLTPLTGDEIWFTPGTGEEHGWVEALLPRTSECLRPPVANVSLLLLVLAPIPQPDMVLADRQISRALAQNIRVAIAVNKTDLDASLAPRLRAEYARANFPVFPVCALSGEGVAELRRALEGELCCLSGQSGAGKSSLLNALLDTRLETGEISHRIARGKNTTRQAELLVTGGLRVMDTAGFNLLEPEKNLPPEQLKLRYPDFLPYEGKCRFRECLHDREPGCAVSAAVASGDLSGERVARYRLLLEETRTLWKERYS